MLSALKFIKKQSGYKRVHNVFVEVYHLHYTSFRTVHGCLWWAGHAWLAVGKLIPDLPSTWERLIDQAYGLEPGFGNASLLADSVTLTKRPPVPTPLSAQTSQDHPADEGP